MEIYIEYVLIDNLVVNTLILLCVKNTLKLKTNRLRIILSSLLGTVVAIILPLLNLSDFLCILIKLALGVFMVLILSKFYRLKDFLFSFLLFIAYTILLVGACIVTLLACGTSLELLSVGGYNTFMPVGVILLIVSLYVYFIIGLGKYLARKRELEPFIKDVRILVNGKLLEFRGFLDSGNRLCDTKTGLPVVILSIKAMERYYNKDELENLILELGKNSEFKNVHLINYGTVSGDCKKMVVFDADKIIINSGGKEYITNRFVVGLSYKVFSDAINYDLLLNGSMV